MGFAGFPKSVVGRCIFVNVFIIKYFPFCQTSSQTCEVFCVMLIGNNLEENEESQLYHKTLINNNMKRSLDWMTISDI